MTFKQKKQEAIRELQEWVDNPLNSKENWIGENKQEIAEELEETKIQKSIRLPFRNINTWLSSTFVFEMLTQEKSQNSNLLAANSLHNLILTQKLSEIYTNRPPSPLFRNCAYWLANVLREKWYPQSKEVLHYMNQWLDTETLGGGNDFMPSSWFIIRIANTGFGINLNYSKYNYPKDMGVYTNAIDNWNTNDLGRLDSFVSQLCDYHLSQAHYGSPENDLCIQYARDDWFVFAFEVLAWLSIREMNGLENPKEFSHPMMQIPLNQLNKTALSIPKDEQFEQAIQKLD